MMFLIDVLQAVEREVRIYLRGGDIGVAENRLHSAKVSAVFHHVSRAAMS
jgi:hypothetical protein